MLIVAHRGASAEYPENTLAAFQRALDLGVHAIELDLHASSDGVPVVIHDRELGRTANGRGNVDGLPLAKLRELDAGDGERIPTLAEVLDLVGSSLLLDLEIKGHGIERAVLATLRQYPDTRWAISSFDWHILHTLRRIDHRAELWPLAEEWSDDLLVVARELNSPVVAVSAKVFTPDNAETISAAGRQAMVWTVNDVEEARRVRDLGAFALCTDDPRRIMLARAER